MPQRHDVGYRKRRARTNAPRHAPEPLNTDGLARALVRAELAPHTILDSPLIPIKTLNARAREAGAPRTPSAARSPRA